MAKQLIIVESPAKAKTISKFLGNDFTVLASMGHVRDLPSNELGFDPENEYEPQYAVSKDKRKIIQQLKKEIDKDTTIFLATDEDREGESIAWHLISALKINKHPIKRIVFHEITKTAILHALETPRDVDQPLVDAQQARRILDRAVGYRLSPLLWRKVKPGLSAGRVQSVAVRILVEREREIRVFEPEEYWKVKAAFQDPTFIAELVRKHGKVLKIRNEAEATEIKAALKEGRFEISNIDERESVRKPVPPFITSTLQQEAARKIGFSVKQTMRIAQQLYEGNFEIPNYSGGLITYMRTDSVNLAAQSLTQAREVILKEFGKEFALAKPRHFTKKAKGAQEAHEAIRPVDLSQKPSTMKEYLSDQQFKLYDLIWKRTLATQMTEAKFAHTTLKISAGPEQEYLLEVKGQRILFPGFLKAYTEGSDDPESALEGKDVILPEVKQGQVLNLEGIRTEQFFTKPPPRYTEASLVKKLESEGIGRPSTYAPTISTIQDRGYVEKTQDKKLKPTHMGEIVTDFLTKHFSEVVDLGFTARIEQDFDEIAHGKKDWVGMMKDFYPPFHGRVQDKEKSVTRAEVFQERILGPDPKSGRPVSVRLGKYGPMIQIGTKDDEEKPLFASIPPDQNMFEMTLEHALKYFDLPRNLGTTEDGQDILVNHGKYGPYVKIGDKYYNVQNEDPLTISLERALELVKEAQATQGKNVIHDFGEIQVRKGPYGFYIKKDNKNYKIPRGTKAVTLDQAACEQIIASSGQSRRK